MINAISPNFCIICRKPTEPGDRKMYPIENPYGNFFFHLTCIADKSNKEILKTIQDYLNLTYFKQK